MQEAGHRQTLRFTKDGTENVDQKIATYSVKSKPLKWKRCCLSFVNATARVNSSTLFAFVTDTDPQSVDSYEFRWDLAHSLVLPVIQERPVQGLSHASRLKNSLFLGL